MSNYRHYGPPTASHHPARAQNARLALNGQTYNYRDPIPHIEPSRPSYNMPYQRMAHMQHVAGTSDQVNFPPYPPAQRQQGHTPATRPAPQSAQARGPDHVAPYTFQPSQDGQRISATFSSASSPPLSDSSDSLFSSSSSSSSWSSSPPPGPVYNYNPVPHSCRPWEMPARAAFPPRAAADGSYVAHISDLPPEVLCQIFLRTAPSQLIDARPHVRAEPLVISHVCHYWRDVALDLPGLWQKLCLTGCRSKHEHRRLQLAGVFMDRSRGTGMEILYQDIEADDAMDRMWEIVVRRQGFGVTPAQDCCYCALDLLITRMAEVRVLELRIGHASSARLAVNPPPAGAMLHDMTIMFMEGGEQTHVISRLYASLKELERFTWATYLEAFPIPPPSNVPWPQLISVYLDTPVPLDMFLEFIASGQRLESVYAQLCRNAHRMKRFSKRIKQTALKELTIYGRESLDPVFGVLQLPSLRDLSLRTLAGETHNYPFAKVTIFQSFLACVRPGLNTLQLKADGCCSETNLISILEMPQTYVLKGLIIYVPHIGDNLFYRLCPELRPPLVPHLQELGVASCVNVDGSIADMIISRHKHGYPLRYFRVTFASGQQGLHEKDLAALRNVATRGLFTKVSYFAGVGRR
ncbi:hypothetical protein EV122DRAFT_210602 [Schizophyllum commune]